MNRAHFLRAGFLVVLFAGCELAQVPSDLPDLALEQQALTTREDFEAGDKSAYAPADVVLASGTWHLADALLGGLPGDARSGRRSLRVRGAGSITMRSDRAGGVGTVTVGHASFGSDARASFGLFVSQDGGATWSQVGAPVATAPGALASASFTVARPGPVRLQLRKLDGGAGRLNLDDLTITDFGGAPPPPPPGEAPPGAEISRHTRLGLPSPASPDDPRDYLAVKSEYVLSYNSERKGPNWVSWELNASYLGGAPRQDSYRTDSTLPASMPQATPADYSGTGWDRGHMCPSGDRTHSTSANAQTFLLTNMVPQATEANAGPWADLEMYSRDLVLSGKAVVVIAGGLYSASSRRIGAGVVVPDATWKVVVVLDRASDGVAHVSASTRVIAVLVPNDDARVDPSDDWERYRVSVRTIESRTGLDFLSDVPRAVQDAIETRAGEP